MGNNLRTALTASKAKLHMVGYANDGNLQPDTLVREWSDIDATAADGLIQGVAAGAQTVASPKIDNQTYAGTWTRGEIKAVPQPGDTRWVTIREYLYLNNSTPTAYFKGETNSVGRRPATYTRYWPFITQAQKTTLMGTQASPGTARASFAYSAVTPQGLKATTYTHYRVEVNQHESTGLCTVTQTGMIPRGSGSGAVDAEPKKVRIVSHLGNTYRLTESHDYGLSEEAAADYADAVAAANWAPAEWGGKGAPTRNLSYTIKEDNGTTYTGVAISFSAAGQTKIDPNNT